MRNFVFTLFAIEILSRAFGNPRTCLPVAFCRWILGGFDDQPRQSSSRRAARVTSIDQAPCSLADKRAAWERRFDLLADTVATLAA